MLIEQAIKTAIEYEQRVRDVYLEAAEKCSDETGKKIFSALAADEAGHVSFLARQLDNWVKDESITWESLKMVIPKAGNLKAVEQALEPTKRQEELALLEQAREAERQTCEFYENMVRELPPKGQALFRQFLEVEEDHLNIVQYQIDSLTGTGFWMGWPDFDMEAMD